MVICDKQTLVTSKSCLEVEGDEETHRKKHPGGLDPSHLLLCDAGDAGAGEKWFVVSSH